MTAENTRQDPGQEPEGGIWKSVAAGVIGGVAGAFAMNQFQSLVSVTKKLLQENDDSGDDAAGGGQDEDATVKTAKTISRKVFGHELTDDEKKWAAPVVHYGLGATLGGIYGLFAEDCPETMAGAGTAYGSAVWLVADEVAVPAFGFSKGPSEYPLSSHVNALASHLVYGVVTDLTRKLLLGL